MLELPYKVNYSYIKKATDHLSEMTGTPLRLDENSSGNYAVYTNYGNAYDKKLTPGYLTPYTLAAWFAGVWLHVDMEDMFNAKQAS